LIPSHVKEQAVARLAPFLPGRGSGQTDNFYPLLDSEAGKRN